MLPRAALQGVEHAAAWRACGPQTKDTLTLKISSFGSKCELPDALMKKIGACGISELVTSTAQLKEQRGLKKGDGAKRSRLVGGSAAQRTRSCMALLQLPSGLLWTQQLSGTWQCVSCSHARSTPLRKLAE